MVVLHSSKAASPATLGAFAYRRGPGASRNTIGKGPLTVRSVSTSVLTEVKSAPNATLAPLSALPTGVLLRSLLVATITSKPYLLRPSLSILSLLSKSNRGWLLNVDRSIILHSILKWTFYKQFCAGETGAESRATVQHLKDMGFQGTILTYAKEIVFDHSTHTQQGLGVTTEQVDQDNATEKHCPHIEAWRTGTLKTIDLLGEEDYLAMKLTGAGPTVAKAFAAGQMPPQQMIDALEEICEKCKVKGARVLVDAESQHFQRGIQRVTLEVMRQFNRDGYALVYNTYQAYLKSIPTTLAHHLAAASDDGFTLGLKLVRGAYIASDDRSLIHDTKQDTDEAYNSIAQGALRKEIGEFGAKNGRPFPSVNLFLASHNKASVLAAHSLHQQRTMEKLPTVPVGFAQLHGMSDDVSFGLLQLKGPGGSPQVYKCSTWGGMGECLAYLLRRAIENRDAVSRTQDEFQALKREVGRRLKAFVTFST
ncbi:FAD-linked oxidoreductase-like protein [Aspergillus alliaceus]|uniref:FAD-linked oxidoreductase-like protein n=1 Tax=Petromyces alliaceus TaxID=209559 RepID=UPI0012A4691A|nr:FAD-linked oxidoreductase-like protein [Aspergillus alliaceus]KAB8234196.1 FAD-linked oxidoreductase-like protein [Aspergillus alliaceus]